MSLINSTSYSDECLTALQKLKPKCNIVGKSVDKLKDFSKKHKTIDQTLGIKKEKDKKKFSLKEFSQKHKTLDKTIESFKKK